MAEWYQQCDDENVHEIKNHSLETLCKIPSLTETRTNDTGNQRGALLWSEWAIILSNLNFLVRIDYILTSVLGNLKCLEQVIYSSIIVHEKLELSWK